MARSKQSFFAGPSGNEERVSYSFVNYSGSDRQATDTDVGSYDSREGGGRVAPGAATESNAGAVTEMEEMQ